MYTIQSKIVLKAPIEEVWDFFSSPHNLKKITPKKMNFKILSSGEGKMYAGQIISYVVSPFAGIPLNWVTEITHIEQNKYFVDEQRIGPYRLWHHEHHFREVKEGIEMTDIVSYSLPLGFIGRIAHALFVKKQVENIFKYRNSVINNYFTTN